MRRWPLHCRYGGPPPAAPRAKNSVALSVSHRGCCLRNPQDFHRDGSLPASAQSVAPELQPLNNPGRGDWYTNVAFRLASAAQRARSSPPASLPPTPHEAEVRAPPVPAPPDLRLVQDWAQRVVAASQRLIDQHPGMCVGCLVFRSSRRRHLVFTRLVWEPGQSLPREWNCRPRMDSSICA